MNGLAKTVCILIIISLTAFLIYAFFTGHVVADQFHVWKVVWGVYVWADAYSGFLLMSTLIYAYERRLGLTVVLFLAACCTGNMVNAAWLLWRGPDLYRRITARGGVAV
jgi:hypothetical protein